MVAKKDDVISELAKRTGWYKKDIKIFMDNFEEMIFDMLKEATLNDDVELQLATGLYICSQRVPSREAKDPRNQETIVTPEKNLPYVTFTKTFRDKINY